MSTPEDQLKAAATAEVKTFKDKAVAFALAHLTNVLLTSAGILIGKFVL